MSCTSCLVMVEQEEYNRVEQAAIKFMKENGKSTAIYKDGNEWKYGDAFTVYSDGFGPTIRNIISKYNGDTAK